LDLAAVRRVGRPFPLGAQAVLSVLGPPRTDRGSVVPAECVLRRDPAAVPGARTDIARRRGHRVGHDLCRAWQPEILSAPERADADQPGRTGRDDQGYCAAGTYAAEERKSVVQGMGAERV